MTEPGPFLLQVLLRVNVWLNVGPQKAQLRVTSRDYSVQRFPDSILDMAMQRSFLTGYLKESHTLKLSSHSIQPRPRLEQTPVACSHHAMGAHAPKTKSENLQIPQDLDLLLTRSQQRRTQILETSQGCLFKARHSSFTQGI